MRKYVRLAVDGRTRRRLSFRQRTSGGFRTMAGITARRRGSTWEYRFEGAPIEGKRKQYSKGGFRTKKDALEAGAKAYSEYNETGTRFIPSEVSFSDYLDLWYKAYVVPNLSPNTQRTYSNLMRLFVKPALGSIRLRAISSAAITEWLTGLREKVSHSTIQICKVIVMSSLDYAVEPMHLIRTVPYIGKAVTRQKGKEKPKTEDDVLTQEQIDMILNEAGGRQDRRMVTLLGWNLGTRIGESIGLCWDNVDIDRMTVTIGIQSLEGEPRRFAQPKTEGSVRTIPFGKTLQEELRNAKRSQQMQEMEYGGFYTVYIAKERRDSRGEPYLELEPKLKKDMRNDDVRVCPVCVKENGKLPSNISIASFYRTASEKLGFRIHSHAFRHSHATNIIDAGVDPVTVQHRLGHSDISTTLGRYVHPTQARDLRAVEAQEAVNSGIRGQNVGKTQNGENSQNK